MILKNDEIMNIEKMDFKELEKLEEIKKIKVKGFNNISELSNWENIVKYLRERRKSLQKIKSQSRHILSKQIK